ncbi:hypothetical protein JHK87_044769 [Glycine soja]|nr:hypothetical protein JHK87_044769 [Glycine soja]
MNTHPLVEIPVAKPIIPMEHFLEQVAWPRAQLPLVRPNEATPPEPTPARVESVPTDPQSTVVNPPSSLELEVVPPSPPLIIISDSPSGEVAAPRESPTGEVADLSYSLLGEAVALSDSPVFPSDR